jgi:hypothetical protein
MHNKPSWKKKGKGSEEEKRIIIAGIKCLANERMQA